jgi:hypothetical protein
VKEEDTVIRFAGTDATIGGRDLAMVAGPCSIESREQAFAIAEQVAAAGAQFFRGGAYKPRTSPYAFQGLGLEALKIMAEIRDRFRAAHRHRGARQRDPRPGGRMGRRDPDRRAQHAEFLAAQEGRASCASRCCSSAA